MRVDEDKHQVWLANWLDAIGVLWCHVPNGGKRAKVTAANLKRQGVKAGVPDVLIFTPPPIGGYVGAALELKAGKGRTSKAQRVWLYDLEVHGWATAVAHGWVAAQAWLESLGYGVKR